MTIQTANEHDGRFLLNNEADIRALLNKLQRRRSRVTGHFENNNNIFSTCLLEVGKSAVILDDTCDEAISNRILASTQLLFSSICGGAPVSFVSSHIERCIFEGIAAFSIPLPTTVHWIQRREYFRLPTPVIEPAICEITLDNGEIARNPLSDISVGGIGMLAQVSSPTLKQGTRLGSCCVVLPEFGKLTSDIRICNSANITLGNGNLAKRYGCQFIDMPHEEKSQLQHYMSRHELTIRANHAHS